MQKDNLLNEGFKKFNCKIVNLRGYNEDSTFLFNRLITKPNNLRISKKVYSCNSSQGRKYK